MRILLAILLCVPAFTSAEEIILLKGKGYIVPDGKMWTAKNVPAAECRVCTSDIYIKGELSNVKVGGVTFHGNGNFSINNGTHDEIMFYPGTELWLGDSRRELKVNEESL